MFSPKEPGARGTRRRRPVPQLRIESVQASSMDKWVLFRELAPWRSLERVHWENTKLYRQTNRQHLSQSLSQCLSQPFPGLSPFFLRYFFCIQYSRGPGLRSIMYAWVPFVQPAKKGNHCDNFNGLGYFLLL